MIQVQLDPSAGEDSEEEGFLLGDNTVWILDPDVFMNDTLWERVVGLMFYEGILYYMDGSLKWKNVEHAKTNLRSING